VLRHERRSCTNGENLLFRPARAKFPRAKHVACNGECFTDPRVQCENFVLWRWMTILEKVGVQGRGERDFTCARLGYRGLPRIRHLSTKPDRGAEMERWYQMSFSVENHAKHGNQFRHFDCIILLLHLSTSFYIYKHQLLLTASKIRFVFLTSLKYNLDDQLAMFVFRLASHLKCLDCRLQALVCVCYQLSKGRVVIARL
jgi:hypothetical protein